MEEKLFGIYNNIKNKIIMSYTLSPKSSDFIGYPFEAYTYVKTEDFQRSNCAPGQNGSIVPFSKTYTSYISDDDAFNKSIQDESVFNAEGTANANSNGTCSVSCVSVNEVMYPYHLQGVHSNVIYGTRQGATRFIKGVIDGGLPINFPKSSNIVDSDAYLTAPVSPGTYYRPIVYSRNSMPNDLSMRLEVLSPINPCTPWSLSGIDIELDSPLGNTRARDASRYLYGGTGAGINGVIYVTKIHPNGNNLKYNVWFEPTASQKKLIGVITPPSGYNAAIGSAIHIAVSPSGVVVVTCVVARGSGSGENIDERRVLVYQVTKDIFGTPSGITEIYNDFTNIRLYTRETIIMGTTLAIFYTTFKGGYNPRDRMSTVGPDRIPEMTLGVNDLVLSAISTDTEIYVTVARSSSSGYTDHRLRKFTKGANSWVTLYP